MSFRGFRKSSAPGIDLSRRSSSPDTTVSGSLPPGSLGSKLEHYETSYMEYLDYSHEMIYNCSRSCLCWSAPYNGEQPAPNSLLMVEGGADDSLLLHGVPGVGVGGGGMDTEPSSTAATPSASKTIESVFVEAQRQLSADLGPGAEAVMPVVGGAKTGEGTQVLPGTRAGNEVDKEERGPVMSGILKKDSRTSNNNIVDVSASTDSGCSSMMTGDGSPKAGDSTAGTSTSQSCGTTDESARLTPLPRDSCADSVTSEADSALSASSSTTDQPTGVSNDHQDNPPSPSRSDSPLNDNFNNNDFNAFLLSLKRVKTPVEFCDSIEDSMSEIDALINDLRAAVKSSPVSATASPSAVRPTDSTDRGSLRTDSTSSVPPLPLTSSTPIPSRSEPTDVFPPLRSRSSTDKSRASSDGLSDVSTDDALERTSATRPTSAVFTPQRPLVQSGPQTPNFPPTKYNLGTPNIGPFLSALLSKLETMMANTLYVNLLLTGVIARLACYPQPLLRSFLLNHSLVFQPTVKSLVQVLGSVKHKVDCYSYTVKDFESLLLRARRFLAWREEQYYHSQDDRGRPRSVTDLNTLPPAHTRTRGGSVAELPRVEKKKTSTLSDLLFRRSPLGNKKPASRDPRLQILGDGKGIRYINRTAQDATSTNDKMESVKTKNAVYCALVLEEFLKEIAAISQEHAVLSLEGGASLLVS